MMRNLSLVLLVSAVACSDKEDGSGGDAGTTGGGGGGGGGANIADYINVTDAPVGNLSCFSAADGLGTESAAPGCVGERQMSGSVVDFKETRSMRPPSALFGTRSPTRARRMSSTSPTQRLVHGLRHGLQPLHLPRQH